MKRKAWTATIVVAVAVIYVLRLDRAAGLVVDDAWYILLGKAIAQGDGFRLISSATAQILPAVPPGFPAILAVVFRLSPEFPDNVLLLKGVSVAAMLCAGVLTYRYFVRSRGVPASLAAVVSVATVISPAFVFLATSTVMAECVFTLGQLATMLVLERSVKAKSSHESQWGVVLGGAMGAATVLVRTAGVAAVLAGGLYLVKKRGWRSAFVFAATVAACLTPWVIYSRAHAPTDEQRLEHGGSIAYAYGDLLAMRRGGEAGSGRITRNDLPGRLASNMVNVFGRDVGGILFPAAFRGPGESGEEIVSLGGGTDLQAASMGGATATMVVSFVLSAFVMVGFFSAAHRRLTSAELLVPITIAMVVLVPSRTFRYVLPLAPFLLFYFFTGLEAVAAVARRSSPPGLRPSVRIAALCVVLLLGWEHALYVWHARNGSTPDWLGDHAEVRGLIDWMNRNLASEGAVATTNPGLVFLLTGRKTVASDNAVGNWVRWKDSGIRYAAALRPADLPPAGLGYRVVYQSLRRRLWIIDLGSESP